MINWLNKSSIKKKIILMSTATSAIVLTFAAVVLIASDYVSERNAIVESTSILAKVIGINSGAALAFQDPDAAKEILSALAVRTDIAAGSIRARDGEIFAAYYSSRPQHKALLNEIQANEGQFNRSKIDAFGTSSYVAQFRSSYLELSAPLKVSGEMLGVISINVDLAPLASSIYQFGLSIIIFLLLAFFLAYGLSRWLQRSVTTPISNFSKAMLEVAESGDYSRRSEYGGPDEIGVLGSSFNIMLQQIESRDQKLEEFVDKLELATEAKSIFLANMSHEIRTPMNGILGLTALLLKMPTTDKQRQYHETINSSAQSLMGIINDVLDISKIESGHFHIEKSYFDLTENIEDVKLLLEHSAQKKNLKFYSSISAATPSKLIGDPGRLRQIIINLVGNAIKFTARGSVSIAVSVLKPYTSSVDLLFEV
ncbi:MAG: signal transduction histidine kinase, partial [Oceanicoccus sp.]